MPHGGRSQHPPPLPFFKFARIEEDTSGTIPAHNTQLPSTPLGEYGSEAPSGPHALSPSPPPPTLISHPPPPPWNTPERIHHTPPKGASLQLAPKHLSISTRVAAPWIDAPSPRTIRDPPPSRTECISFASSPPPQLPSTPFHASPRHLPPSPQQTSTQGKTTQLPTYPRTPPPHLDRRGRLRHHTQHTVVSLNFLPPLPTISLALLSSLSQSYNFHTPFFILY